MDIVCGFVGDMKLFADFRQIHVSAPDRKGDLAEAWTAQATEDRIAVAGDIVGITASRSRWP
ncbi:MAG: hypothetical protein KIT84_28960 [Labilithrix sp.]|nr:hypothetical protein [Labilithrix sp.]MCW5815091.1 hypothetical protein [Labilithrix sp.]